MEQTEIDRLKAENEQLKAQLNQSKNDGNANFIDDLIAQGKLIPKHRARSLELLNYANNFDNGETLTFSEGENLTQKIKDFFQELPQVICFEEIATTERAATINDSASRVTYADDTPPEMIALDQEIRAYMGHHNTDYLTAFNIITKKGA
ncbi:hypothetical protein [Spirabiliibacterium falconis]|uniref:hypothetical protein n=1 Tax=Spirabiliibacterium falconis TaxID=572023 RepID=UPI001AAD7184|nr:hypothetical protein [Spirabiliibacterium falconis]MBE2893459.1 hypothetical protein [Spirabiliibacterium falconis]